MITTDTEIRLKGLKALTASLGDVEAERFISLIQICLSVLLWLCCIEQGQSKMT